MAFVENGPRLLAGVDVVELAGLAPVPFCGMVLADFGADVLVINSFKRPNSEENASSASMGRGKHAVTLDMRNATDVQRIRKMLADADVLLDPFRPGVMEDIGLDPRDLLKANPGLVIARLSGFGQTGPWCRHAGHDINFVAMSGVMGAVCGGGCGDTIAAPLRPPANLLGDFAGGGLLAAFGVVAALFRRHSNGGRGCLLDCSMTEGVSYLSTFISHFVDSPLMFNTEYGLFSGRCPIYRCYETRDGRHMAVGAIEPKFHRALFQALGMDAEAAVSEMLSNTEALSRKLETLFRKKTRDEWTKVFKENDACVTPVLDPHEVGAFPQHAARNAFTTRSDTGAWISRPAPRVLTPNENPKEETPNKSKL